MLEERRALQEKLAGTDAEMEQLARQRSLESQQHNRDSNMIVELQNKIVSAMHTLQREQSVNQTLQQKLDRSDQLWKVCIGSMFLFFSSAKVTLINKSIFSQALRL